MNYIDQQDSVISGSNFGRAALFILAGVLLIAEPGRVQAQSRSLIDASPTQMETERNSERARPGRVQTRGYRHGESNEETSGVGTVPEWAQSQSSEESFRSSSPKERFRSNADDPGRAVPIDGGLIWLVLAGLGYGGYRLRGTE